MYGSLVGSCPSVGGGKEDGGGAMDLISGLLGGGGGDPMSNLQSSLKGMGVEGSELIAQSGAPTNKPPSNSTADVATPITGCRSHETSADVTPLGQKILGAITMTLSDVYFANPDISHYDLVS